MASGLPVVASDLPVHKEVCGEAAQYFQRFSPASLAEAVAKVAACSEFTLQLSTAGRKRSHDFSWARHVEVILNLAAGALMPNHACLSLHSRSGQLLRN